MNQNIPKAIQIWHTGVTHRDASMLDTLLADDVAMYSPVVFTPQTGKTITTVYLTAAMHVLVNDKFKYIREVYGDTDAMLEFETELDGIYINGIDMISWNANNQITSFKVMVRPLQAVNKLHQLMAMMLDQLNKK